MVSIHLTIIKGGIIKMDTSSNSQTKNESEGQTGCEACIKKDEIIPKLYEALKELAPCMRPVPEGETPYEWAISERAMKVVRKALALARGE